MIEECNIGSGAACGSIYLDKGFETLLRNKLGRQGNSILTEKRLAESRRHFDSAIKRQYNPYDDHGETEFEIPLTGAPDLPAVGLEEGYLTLSTY
jgi:hypothetical protein